MHLQISMKRLLIVGLALLTFLLGATESLACVCNVRSLSKRTSESRIVFVGTLVKRSHESEGGQTRWRNQFSVERYWKGTPLSEVTVFTTLDDCASWFELGQTYLVLAYYVKDSRHLETDTCMGTGSVDRVATDLKMLGKGKRVAHH
jgi:hypothetical protein